MPPLLRRVALASAVALFAACGKQESAPPPQPAAAVPAAPPKPAPVVPSAEGKTTPAITAEDFASRLQKISGDAFEGRKPGTIGERMSTAWIKDQFEQIGLKPGDGASWIQTVPMVETTLLDADGVSLDVAAKDGAEHFAYRKPTKVTRYVLPKIGAMNFVLDDVLDGGVNDALNLDMHGKSLSFHLLTLSIEIPEDRS